MPVEEVDFRFGSEPSVTWTTARTAGRRGWDGDAQVFTRTSCVITVPEDKFDHYIGASVSAMDYSGRAE